MSLQDSRKKNLGCLRSGGYSNVTQTMSHNSRVNESLFCPQGSWEFRAYNCRINKLSVSTGDLVQQYDHPPTQNKDNYEHSECIR